MRLRTLLIIMFLTVSFIPIGIIGGIQGFQSTSLILIGLIVVVTFAVSLIIAYLLTRPLERLTGKIDAISKGKLDVKLENSEIYEINKLTTSLDRVMASLKLAIHKVGLKKGEVEETAKEKTFAVEKYRDLLDNITGWAWEVDDKMAFTFCSNNVSEVLGYTSKEIIGKKLFDFTSPEEAKKVKATFSQASDQKAPIKNLEIWIFRKDGDKICIVMNGVPFFDDEGMLIGYRGIDINITGQKQSEEKTQKLETELTNLRNQITDLLNERKNSKTKMKGKRKPKKTTLSKNLEEKWSEHEFDSVFIFDEHANILDCNENMYKKLGYTKGEMLSLNVADFDALETKDDILDKINNVKKAGSLSFKTIHKRKDGSAVLVYENMLYLKDKNMFKCIVRQD
jgi:PAS domain S-box-containing protein